jgi:hypothetical protein
MFRLLGESWGYNIQLAVLVAAFVGICFGVFAIVGWTTNILSGVLARYLNSLATFHVAQSVYGGDEVGITAQTSTTRAFDGTGLSHRLPEHIEDAIRGVADAAASNTISRLRRKISLLISSIGGRDELGSGDHFLTWDELIHTTYFRVTELRILLCAAIARSNGFVASDLLQQNEHARRLSDWLTSIERLRSPESGN